MKKGMIRKVSKYGIAFCLTMTALFLTQFSAAAGMGTLTEWQQNSSANAADLSIKLPDYNPELDAVRGDISGMHLILELEVSDRDNILSTDFIFEESLRDLTVLDTVYVKDQGKMHIFAVGNENQDEIVLEKGKKLELGTLVTESAEDIAVRVTQLEIVADGTDFDLSGLNNDQGWILKATDQPENPENGTDSPDDNEDNDTNTGEDNGSGSLPDGTQPEDGEDENGSSGSSGSGGSGNTGSSSGGGSSRPQINRTEGMYTRPQENAAETEGSWQQIGEEWKFRLKNGMSAQNTWILVDGHWYHMNMAGYMDKGWYYQAENNSWYWLRDSGAMKQGWLQLENKWYYLNADGRMQTGWLESNGYTYYLKPEGEMLTGWQEINGKYYCFNWIEPVPVSVTDPVSGERRETTEGQMPFGAMYRNTMTPDGTAVGADGSR